MRRLLIVFVLLSIVVVVWWSGWGQIQNPASQPLTPENIARLEPELCGDSALIRLLTVVPIAPRSLTQSLDLEQVALISQYKAGGWRKLWILRLPAAYVTMRPCDAGRQNWTGSGDSINVSQYYELSLILINDEIVPATRAIPGKHDTGLGVAVTLHNTLINPTRRHKLNAQSVNGHMDSTHPPRCREEEGGNSRPRAIQTDQSG